ncbi:MAG: transporter substrate-binding domain-containing protein [Deltaproteobacteria bacterium]|nr:transporter substrate-binding domain-containing protein [Deltaproteobacteria bacterium]
MDYPNHCSAQGVRVDRNRVDASIGQRLVPFLSMSGELTMMTSKIYCFLLVFCIVASVHILLPEPVFARSTIKIVAYDYPPYYSAAETANKGHGFISDIVTAAFNAVDVETIITYQPVRRSVKSFKNGNFAAYFGSDVVLFSVMNETEVDSFFLCTYYLLFNYFKSHINHELTYENLTDLKGYKIGDIVGSQEPLEQVSLTVELAPRLEQGMKKLASGRVDLWVTTGVTAFYLVRTHLPERLSDLTFIKKPLGQGDVKICFLKRHKDSEKMKALYIKGLKIIRHNGTCENILKNYFGKNVGQLMNFERSLPSCSQ